MPPYPSQDLVTVVVQGLLAKGERSLVRDGEADLVLDIRSAYQETMRDELTAGVEQITGRPVIAFLSANHIEPDIAIESFVLSPEGDEAAPQAEDEPPAGRNRL
jgi:uncharacterized protein YbcI